MSVFLVAAGLFAVLFIDGIHSVTGGERKLVWEIEINEKCTINLIENDKTSNDFKVMKKKVEDGIKYVYRNNADFKNISIIAFKCRRTLIVGTELIVKNVTDITTFTKIFQDDVNDKLLNTSANSQLSIISSNVTIGSFKPTTPGLYAKMSGSIANVYFCNDRLLFKEKLAGRLILMDGYSTANANQVIIFNHACGNAAVKLDYFENIHFYISKNAFINETDTKLTLLAFKVIEQMIYDGTTWRLGIHLYKYLDKIKLMGKDAPDFGLADVQIIFIGVGAVAVLILLIIIIVYLVACYKNNHCCCKKEFEVQISIEPSKEIGVTNQLFEKETFQKPVADYTYDAIIEPPDITFQKPVADYTYDAIVEPPDITFQPPVADYVYDTVDEKPADTFQAPPPVDDYPDTVEIPDDADYENMEYVPLHEGVLLASNDSEFDTDDDDDYDDVNSISIPDVIDDGKDLDIDNLASAVYDLHGLEEEFNSLPMNLPNSISYPPECDHKNRIKGRFPWTETRVVLSTEDKDHESIEDYINASFVKEDNIGRPVCIATQAPLQSTTNDFWKMIWEQNVAVIVMATPLRVKEKELCCQYWPPDQIARRYDQITVQLIKKELKPDFLVITVVATNGLERRQIYLFRYMSWPNSDIPDNTKSIVGFLLEIREVMDAIKSSPPVFHCSSGTGMSATFIAIISGMLSLESTNAVNVKRIVRLLREDLAGGVETPEQYKFLYEALYQYAQFNP